MEPHRVITAVLVALIAFALGALSYLRSVPLRGSGPREGGERDRGVLRR